jgi:hypothetical protein
MKRKLSETKSDRSNRLQELLSFVDHLSPTITVDHNSVPLTAVQLETGNEVIEVFEPRRLLTDRAVMRQSVERYLSDISDITLVIPTALSSHTSYTVTMDDGTTVQCAVGWRANDLICVEQKPVLRPADLIRAVKTGEFDDMVSAIEDGVNVNAKDSRDTDSILVYAATLSDAEDPILEYLLDVPGIDTEQVDADGDPILHRVLHCISVKGLTAFARRGAGMYAQDKHGRSVLHIAMTLVHTLSREINVILEYAPILTLHTDKTGCLSTDNVSRDVRHSKAVKCALRLIRPVRKKMIDQVTEAIDRVIPVRAVGRLILNYYTVPLNRKKT